MVLLVTLLSIFAVNILLSGDNALVIALASRELPPKHQKMAILLGSGGAVVLRIILTFIAVYLLQIPFLKLIGGLLLFWIAVKLIADEESNGEIEAKDSLWGAVQTIIVADLVMSLDNVVAIAGVANGNMILIIVGLVMSIPIVIWGSKLISLLMKRWPITIIIGAGILGWTAGEMAISDKKIEPFLSAFNWTSWIIPLAFAVTVILVGVFISRRTNKQDEAFHAGSGRHHSA
ncbi:integral membrane TerC family protein [Desulfosporosinus sp. OT]|nr:integral membrane TerC family protein [Desulfosporosinus sp. OT]